MKPYLGEDNLLHLPQNTLVVLCGLSGSGKSSFANRHFPETNVISSDKCRALISDNMRNLEINTETFGLVYYLTRLRLKARRLTVIDSTALRDFTRKAFLTIAKDYNFQTLLLVLDISEEVCRARDAARIDPPPVGSEVVAEQYRQYQETLKAARYENFDVIIILTQQQIDQIGIQFDK